MLFSRTANRGTPTRDNPVPSFKFRGITYYKLHKSLYYVSKSGQVISLKQKNPRMLHHTKQTADIFALIYGQRIKVDALVYIE